MISRARDVTYNFIRAAINFTSLWKLVDTLQAGRDNRERKIPYQSINHYIRL
jgi:hypothetical protein